MTAGLRFDQQAGDAAITIDAGQGCRLASLRIAGNELLVPEREGPLRWGCYPMAPWVGRTRRGRFNFEGREHQLPVNLGPHAIHGTLLGAAWRPLDPPFAFEVETGPDWPFPGLVRQQMRKRAGEELERGERELVEVLTTELVTNAVTHPGPEAGNSVSIHFAVAPERIRVEVCDDGAGFCSEQLEEPRTRPGGYGLVLVERGSSRWGAARDDGNCVWFELDRAAAAAL